MIQGWFSFLRHWEVCPASLLAAFRAKMEFGFYSRAVIGGLDLKCIAWNAQLDLRSRG